MQSMHNCFESQAVQIASLGAWNMVTGKPLKRRLDQVADPRWDDKPGLFVTLRKEGQTRGSMGVLEYSQTLPETLFDVGGQAATHDSRYEPISESELESLEIELSMLKNSRRLFRVEDIIIGQTGVMIFRGENQALLLPEVAVENQWTAEQFLEACCEKANLSHKAWKDPNTLVEIFEVEKIQGGRILDAIQPFIS